MPATPTALPSDPSWKLVSRYLTRAESEHGVVRKQVAALLGVTSPALSAWTTDNTESKISLEQLRPFAAATRMCPEELAELVLIRLQEKDGQKLHLDLPLVIDAISCILPTPEENDVLEIYRETCGLVGFRMFNDPEHKEKLAAAFRKIASDAVSDHVAEG